MSMAATRPLIAVLVRLPISLNRITFHIGKNLPILLDQTELRQKTSISRPKNGKN
jgi:hypothetical protein